MHQYLGIIHCQVINALINIFHTALLLELLGAVFLIPELLTKLTMPQWARFKLCSSMFMFSTHPCTHSPNIYKDTDTPILFLSYVYLFTNMNLDAIQVQCSAWDCFAGPSLSRPAVATQTCGYCRIRLLLDGSRIRCFTLPTFSLLSYLPTYPPTYLPTYLPIYLPTLGHIDN